MRPPVKAPPSLKNIYKELASDLGPKLFTPPAHGNLEQWADRGVLLLNACLTVEAHKAFSHRNKGWCVAWRGVAWRACGLVRSCAVVVAAPCARARACGCACAIQVYYSAGQIRCHLFVLRVCVRACVRDYLCARAVPCGAAVSSEQ